MTEPTTEAGARLLAELDRQPCLPEYEDARNLILAIEAEARAGDAEILALLDRWEADGQGDLVSATAIRALLADTEAEPLPFGTPEDVLRATGIDYHTEAERHG